MLPWYSTSSRYAAEAVVGTTAGRRRSGTRSTIAIAWSAARAIVATVLVAEAAQNTLGCFCKKQQRTAARHTQQRLRHESARGPRSHQRDTAREDGSRNTGKRNSEETQQTTDPWHSTWSPNRIGQTEKNKPETLEEELEVAR